MSVVLLDPRFPAMIPVEAVPLLSGDVSYTEEVPVRVRWVIADLGGHTVDESDVVVTTDLTNPLVRELLGRGEELVKAPSLLVEMEPQRQLEASDATGSAGSAQRGSAGFPSDDAINGTLSSAVGATPAQPIAERPDTAAASAVVDGDIVGTDEHTATVAGMRRTTRTEVPASVMDEIEDAVALMARALRQGEWERGMTHASLIKYLREETEELSQIVAAIEEFHNPTSAEGVASEMKGETPEWVEQELCRELSDVLLQVLFHAEIANRRGAFDIGHVAGAFVAKMRSRAPYLFESVEREVPKNEQDRLWEEGKRRERREREQALGGPDAQLYAVIMQEKDKAATEVSAGDQLTEETEAEQATRVEPHAKAFPAQRGAQPPQEDEQAPMGNGRVTGLEAAEMVIREARELGMRDSDIPMDVRYPMVGLEMDQPGEADRRLFDAAVNFRAQLKRSIERQERRNPEGGSAKS